MVQAKLQSESKCLVTRGIIESNIGLISSMLMGEIVFLLKSHVRYESAFPKAGPVNCLVNLHGSF